MRIERRETAGGKVRWRVQVFVGRDPQTGKRQVISRTYPTRDEAKREGRRLEEMRDYGGLTAPSKAPLSTYLDQWLDAKAGRVRPRTIHDYRGILTRYVITPPEGAPPIGSIAMHRLTPEAFEALYAWLWTDAKLAPRTIAYLHTVLRQALSEAVKKRALHRNPTDNAERPTRRQEATEKKIRAMSQEEAQRFLEAAQTDRYAALWALLLLGGLRPGEALGMMWEDVDVDEGRVHVRRALTRTGVKGWKLDEPKTDRARRVVPLPAVALTALKAWRRLTATERLQLGSEYTDHGFVFCTPFGHPLDQGNLYSRNFRRICAAAELGQWEMRRAGGWIPWDGESKRRRFRPAFRMYDLRHTCATLLLGRGVAAKIVSERLGHASITLTLDTYSHVLPHMQESAVDALNAAFGGS